MKKVLLSSIILTTLLYSEEITILPYLGVTINDGLKSKSLKNSTGYLGLYASYKEDQNQFDFACNFSNVAYKSGTPLSDFKQKELTLKYVREREDILLSLGMHTISSGEDPEYTDLGSGYVVLLGFEALNSHEKKRVSYGVDIYYSLYKKAHTDSSRLASRSVGVAQLSPYIKYSVDKNQTIRNDFTFRLNMISATEYKDPSYISVEFINTTFFNHSYLTLRYLGGDMRSGVTNKGITVYNNKDLYSGIYQATLGYFEVKELAYDISYAFSRFKEFNPDTLVLLPKGKSSTLLASMTYKF